MDNFREEIIVRRTGRGLYSFFTVLTWAFMVLAGIIALISFVPLMNLQFEVVNVILFIVSGGTAFLLWRNKDTLHTEYEYTLTNGEMDFAKVMGNTRRKHLLTIQLKNIEQGGLVDSDGYRRLASGPSIKVTDYTLNKDIRQVYLYFSRDGVRHLIVLEPSEKMLDMMRIYNRVFAV